MAEVGDPKLLGAETIEDATSIGELCPINDHCNFPYFAYFTESNRNGALKPMTKPALKIVAPDTKYGKSKPRAAPGTPTYAPAST